MKIGERERRNFQTKSRIYKGVHQQANPKKKKPTCHYLLAKEGSITW